MKNNLKLFLIMFKIGLFTFGGGYAMVSLLESEFVSKRKWIEHDEFMNMIAIAESTPGPIAINSATYIGYKLGRFWGSLFATLGVILPSFIIIFVISLFFNEFLKIAAIAAIFKGLQVGVIFLILSAGIKLFKKLEKSVFNYIVMGLTFASMILFSVFAVNFSSIFYVLLSGIAGLVVFLIKTIKQKNKEVQK